MEPVILEQILNTSVSLGVLAVVLMGVYKLTNRMIDVTSKHIDRCCESLERIADALEDLSERKP